MPENPCLKVNLKSITSGYVVKSILDRRLKMSKMFEFGIVNDGGVVRNSSVEKMALFTKLVRLKSHLKTENLKYLESNL